MKAVSLSLLPLLFCSCKVVSPSSHISEVSSLAPASWAATEPAQAGVDAQWIQRFHDPLLESLIREGVQHNKNLKATAIRLTQAQQRANAAGAASRPKLDLTGNGNRQKTQFIGFQFPGSDSGAQYNSFGVSLNANWELDLWGRVRAGQAAAIAAYEGQYWNARAAEASLQAQITKAYFALCEAETQVTLAQQAQKNAEQLRDAIKERFVNAITEEGGTGAQYRLVESDVKTSEAEIARWEGQVDTAARQIELLIGRYPSGVLQGSGELPALPKAAPAGLPSALLLRRPDILASERAYTESLKRKEETARAIFPIIKLTASGGTATGALKNILSSSAGIWSLGANLTQSILTGGILSSERNITKSEADARLIELQDTVLQAFGEVEASLSQERFLLRQFQATEAALALSEEAGTAAREDYAAGVTTLQTVLNADARKITAASTLTTLQRLLLDNRTNLHLALGGDYKPSSK